MLAFARSLRISVQPSTTPQSSMIARRACRSDTVSPSLPQLSMLALLWTQSSRPSLGESRRPACTSSTTASRSGSTTRRRTAAGATTTARARASLRTTARRRVRFAVPHRSSPVSDAVAAPQPFYVNDGTRDIGSAPTQILLLRGLDTLTTEMDIVTSLGKITGRIGSEVRNGGVRKVLITKDRASRSSWGYAFVQFSNVTVRLAVHELATDPAQLATEVLATVFNPAMYPTGYRIRSSVVAFSFCHENSFVPVYAHSEWAFQGEGGQQLTYWDDKAFVSAWVPTAPRAAPAGPTRKQPGATTDSDVDAFLSSFGEDTKMLEVPEAAFVPKTESGPSSSPDKVIVEAVRGPGSIETVVPSAPAASNSTSARTSLPRWLLVLTAIQLRSRRSSSRPRSPRQTSSSGTTSRRNSLLSLLHLSLRLHSSLCRLPLPHRFVAHPSLSR